MIPDNPYEIGYTVGSNLTKSRIQIATVRTVNAFILMKYGPVDGLIGAVKNTVLEVIARETCLIAGELSYHYRQELKRGFLDGFKNKHGKEFADLIRNTVETLYLEILFNASKPCTYTVRQFIKELEKQERDELENRGS